MWTGLVDESVGVFTFRMRLFSVSRIFVFWP
jgi:hypothetical protein